MKRAALTVLRFIARSPLLLLACCLAYLAAAAFIADPLLRLVFVPAGALLVLRAWYRQRRLRRKLFGQEQFRWFLELLITRVSAGSSLEHAIEQTLPDLGKILGRKSHFMQILAELCRLNQAGQPLEQIIRRLSGRFTCPEAELFFRILPDVRRTGCPLAPFVRQHLRMLSERISLQQDLSAESTQRRTEALCLSVMPFIMAWLLRQTLDRETAAGLQSGLGLAVMMGSLMLAIIAAALTLGSVHFDMDRRNHQTRPPVGKERSRVLSWPGLQFVRRIYRDLLPETYGARLLRILYEQAGNLHLSPELVWDRYFQRKLVLIGAALLPAAVLLQSDRTLWPAFLILPAAISFLQDRQVLRIRLLQIEDYRLDYPAFLNLAAALLQTGLTVHNTLRICAAPLRESAARQRRRLTALETDLIDASRCLDAGTPPHLILTSMAADCPIPEAQAALLMIVRYQQSGGSDALQLLEMQAAACWSLYRNTVRKQLEKQSLKLLLPMTMDLITVLLVSLLPALISFRTF